jgi:hypothetical protein
VTYTTVAADSGQTITFEVSPRAATGATPGSAATSNGVVIAGSGALTFTDHPLQARSTPLKAVHITELRQAIAALHVRYSLPAFIWTDASLVPGVTIVKSVHLRELRAALNAVYVAALLTPPTYTDPVITTGVTVITTAHIAELRAAILAIW